MARIINGNTDSGIESDPEEPSVPLVVDSGSAVMTSRDCDHVVPVVDQSDQLSFQLVRSDSSGEVLTISLDSYSSYESEALPEFFDGSQNGKTAKSYLEIRNHFIGHWRAVKPKSFGYHEVLRKVGHLHLGNVTAFSRVQKFLESHHVINEFGKRSALPRPKIEKPKRSFADNQMRKLGVRGAAVVPEKVSRGQRNPFKLVPLETYESEAQSPFAVRLSMEALAIVDVHSHCVKTEVIGLLGGHYNGRELFILTAEPCASLSDHDLQCDMEPVSQAEAKERLEAKDYHVVGWYHSHPTFVPNPSLRDLETQNELQQYFTRETSQPFVALILSPYLSPQDDKDREVALVSKFKCLWLSDQMNAQNDYRIPYELNPQMIRREKLMFTVEHKLRALCRTITGHASRVRIHDKIKRFRGADICHLDKLCHSLRHHLATTGLSAVECDYMLAKCREILVTCLEDDRRDDTKATLI